MANEQNGQSGHKSKIISRAKMGNGENGHNGQSGHKFRIKSKVKMAQWTEWTERTVWTQIQNKIMRKNGQWTQWTQIQNKIMSQMANGQNGQGGHKSKIKS